MSTETRRIQFDFVSRGAREVQGDIERVGQQSQQTAGHMEATGSRGGKAFSGLSAGIGKAAGALGALGLSIGAVSAAISKGMDAEDATAKMQAQLGLTKDAANRIGHDAGKIYAQAYGESMDEVKTSITQVIRNMDGMRDASSADLQATTKRAMDLATVMDEEVGPITVAVSQMMKTGLAKNSKEAFDILTVGAQNGADKAQDLLDTFNEYGTQFRKVGLDGKTAMGLISQGLKGGARDADIVADAIKEFSIRAVNGSESTADGFKKLGLDASRTADMIAHGGPTASKGLDMVLDRLRKVKDPIKQAAIATELFGTQSEDLGKALFKLDPSTAVKGLGNLAGATDRAGAALGGTAKAQITAFKRSLELNVSNFIGDKVLPSLEKLGAAVQGWGKSKDGQKSLTQLRAGLKGVSDWINLKLVPALRVLADWFVKKIWPVIEKFTMGILKELVSQLKRVGNELRTSGVNWKEIAKIIGKVAEVLYKVLGPVMTWIAKIVLKILGTAIILQIKGLIALYNVIVKTIDGFKKGGKTISDWAKNTGHAISALKDFAVSAFLNIAKVWLTLVGSLVHGAAKAFGWVPGLGGKLKTADKQFQTWSRNIQGYIDSLHGKTVPITVNAKGLWATAHDPGRRIPGLSKGGAVPALWGGASEHYDSQPALLRVNEHVWTPEEVKAVGGHSKMLKLRSAAKRGLLQGFASGGAVGVGAHTQSPGQIAKQVRAPINAGYAKMIAAIAAEMAAIWKKFAGSAGGVVAAARSMIGYPYSWGGGGKGGPSYGIGRGAGTFGFDCSGLSQFAWWKGRHLDIGGTTMEQEPRSRPSPRRPGALGFVGNPTHHVMIASDRPGYVIQAPFTGSFVQEVPRSSSNWRWPIGAAGFYAGGPVRRAGDAFTKGLATMSEAKMARGLGIAGRARGGPIASNTPYLVGEHGHPEIVIPNSSGHVVPLGGPFASSHGYEPHAAHLAHLRHMAHVAHLAHAARALRASGSGHVVIAPYASKSGHVVGPYASGSGHAVVQHITVEITTSPGTDRAKLGKDLNDLLLEYKRRGGKIASSS